MLEINKYGVFIGSGITRVVAEVKAFGSVEFRYLCDSGVWRGSIGIEFRNWGASSPITRKNKGFRSLESLMNFLLKELSSKIDEKEFKRFKKIFDEKIQYEQKGQLDLFAD
jgi:hypothetical protein